MSKNLVFQSCGQTLISTGRRHLLTGYKGARLNRISTSFTEFKPCLGKENDMTSRESIFLVVANRNTIHISALREMIVEDDLVDHFVYMDIDKLESALQEYIDENF